MAAIHGTSETTSPGFDRYTELLKATAPITVESEAAVIKKDHSLSRFITAGAEVDHELLSTRIATLILPLRQLGMSTASSIDSAAKAFGLILSADPKYFENTSTEVQDRAYLAVGQLVAVAAKYAANDSRVTAYQALQTLGETLACLDSYRPRRPLDYQKEVDELCLAADFFEIVLDETKLSIGEGLRIYQHLLTHASLYQVDPVEIVGACIDQCKFAATKNLPVDILLPEGCTAETRIRNQSFIGLLDYFYQKGTAAPTRQELSSTTKSICSAISSPDFERVSRDYYVIRDLLMSRLLSAFQKTLTIENLPELMPKLARLGSDILKFVDLDQKSSSDPTLCTDLNRRLVQYCDGDPEQTFKAWSMFLSALETIHQRGFSVYPEYFGRAMASVLPIDESNTGHKNLKEIRSSFFALHYAIDKLEQAGLARSEAADLFAAVRPTVSQAAEGNLYRTHQLGSKLAMLSLVARQKGFSLEEFANEVVKPVFDTAYHCKAQQGLSTEQMMQLSRDLRWLLTATNKEGLLRLIKSGDVLKFILN